VFPAEHVRLTRSERVRLGLEIVAAYLAVRWRLVRSGLPQTVAAARSASSSPPRPADGAASASAALRLGNGVERTLGALPFDSRCLIRSLVLVRILARRGLESSMVLGVSAKPGFTAHAWVEYEGVPLLPTSARFERLAEM
jgi:hypothetical protein